MSPERKNLRSGSLLGAERPPFARTAEFGMRSSVRQVSLTMLLSSPTLSAPMTARQILKKMSAISWLPSAMSRVSESDS